MALLCGLFGLALNLPAFAQGTGCINSTFPQTVTPSVVNGTTQLTLGHPTSTLLQNVTVSISGNFVTLNYVFVDTCITIPFPPQLFVVNLGRLLPPGDYQLRSIGSNGLQSFEVTRPFVIGQPAGSVFVPVPVMSAATSLMLILSIVLVGSFVTRKKGV